MRLINVVDDLVQDEMVVNDVVAGHLGQQDGGVPAHVPGSVLGSLGSNIFKQKYFMTILKYFLLPSWFIDYLLPPA